MRPTTTSTPFRVLLCASAAHCAQVLHAAASAGVQLHGLHPSTQWPSSHAHGQLLLWALTPADHPQAEQAAAIEQHWRALMVQGGHGLTIHMLYGSAAQQAGQLAPWIEPQPTVAAGASSPHGNCRECLDASSEQTLFQHLLRRAPQHPPHNQ